MESLFERYMMEETGESKFWDDVYTPDESVQGKLQPGELETFGEDWEKLKEIARANIKRVWTVIDGEGSSLYAIPGVHYVNRLHYVISNEEWQSGDEEYLY